MEPSECQQSPHLRIAPHASVRARTRAGACANGRMQIALSALLNVSCANEVIKPHDILPAAATGYTVPPRGKSLCMYVCMYGEW